jgi:hypothetical protein
VAPAFLLLDLGDGPRGAVERAEHAVDARLGVEAKLLEVDLLPVDLGQARQERRRRCALEPRLDRPVLLGHEGADLALALADDANRDRLHAPGREAAPHLLPQERRELIADEAVEDAPGLLRLEPVLVDRNRVADALEHGLLRDLVEQDAVDVALARAEPLRDVPGDGLTLAVGVGGEVDVLLVLRRLPDLGEDLGLAVDHLVVGGEVVLDVDTQLRLRQVDHMADRRLHLVVPPEVLPQRLRLGRGLDDHEVLRHAHAARRRKRLPGTCSTTPRSSSASSVSSALPGGRPLSPIT